MGNYDQAYRYIFEYINTFYNTVRIHSHCDYQSPDQYEEAYLKRLAAVSRRSAG
ncbi:IS3 family transposase [Moryella indoligenes]|uniref:IS3 family transposase n=1 Tax=Moryella indoligenes TaxID=371674 RepID=UPI003A7F4203